MPQSKTTGPPMAPHGGDTDTKQRTKHQTPYTMEATKNNELTTAEPPP